MNFGENAESCSCACGQELRALGTVVEQLKNELETRIQQQEQTLGRALASLVPTVEALSAKIDRKNPATTSVPLRGAAQFSNISSASTTASSTSTAHRTVSVPSPAIAFEPASIPSTAALPILHAAAWIADMDLVQRLLAQGADPTSRDTHGDSALHCAAAAGHVAALDALLEATDSTRPVGVSTAEWVACAANARGPKLRTPLHRAAEGGHTDAACSLLAAGANLDAVDANGDTPLHRAAHEGHCAVAALLLAEGATADAVNKDGFTPLSIAAQAGRGSLVRLLLEKGADPQRRDAEGSTALHLAAMAGHRETVQFLLEMGLDVDMRTNNGLTALHAAAQKGNVEVIELLVEKGAKINAAATSKGGETPLLLAALGGHAEAVVTLLAKGASIDAIAGPERIDPKMMSLVAAATGGSSIVVKALAKSGACINSQVVEAALKHASNADVIWALADVAPEQFLQVAEISLPLLAEEGKAEVLQAVLGLGVNVLSKTSVKALQLASEENKADCVAILLQAGVKDNDTAALYGAVRRGHVKVVSAFLEHGMTDELKNDVLKTARKNFFSSHAEVMKILVDEGANPFKVDKDEAWEFVKCVALQKMKKKEGKS